jgi:hypothetical protein
VLSLFSLDQPPTPDTLYVLLEAFYLRHNPQKIDTVPSIVRTYKDRITAHPRCLGVWVGESVGVGVGVGCFLICVCVFPCVSVSVSACVYIYIKSHSTISEHSHMCTYMWRVSDVCVMTVTPPPQSSFFGVCEAQQSAAAALWE